MIYTKLGKTDIDVSVITAGNTAPMPGVVEDRERFGDAVRAVRVAVDKGANLIDTASSYASGESEIIVGNALAEINRTDVLILTKFGMVFKTEDGVRNVHQVSADLSAKNCIETCEQSLKRLKTDYIDLYMPHLPQKDASMEELAGAMQRLKEDGKIRYIGLSNFNRAQIEECARYMEITAVEMPYSMLDREYEGVLQWAVDNKITTFAYGVLGNGILAGRYQALPDISDPSDTRSSYTYFREPEFSLSMEVYGTLRQIADRRGVTAAQVAINWTRQTPCVSSVIIGTSKPQSAARNCEAIDWSLSDDEMNTINATIDRTVGMGINTERFF